MKYAKNKTPMDTTRVQTEIFNYLKTSLPAHLSLVDVVAEVLDLSNDSAYRRIRGEKPVTIDELAKLAHRFEFSIDRFLGLGMAGPWLAASTDRFLGLGATGGWPARSAERWWCLGLGATCAWPVSSMDLLLGLGA